MRFLAVAVTGALCAMLIAPTIGWATSRSDPPAPDQQTGSCMFRCAAMIIPPGPSAAPVQLITEGHNPKKSNLSSGRGAGIRGSFDRFGHSVKRGAVGVGHAVEGGAKDVRRSVVEGWESFKRNFIGR